MLDFFYNILIYPIELIIEFLFVASEKVFKNNSGISILIVSLAVSIGCLPFFIAAFSFLSHLGAIEGKLYQEM